MCINNDTLGVDFHFRDPPFQRRFKMRTFAATVLVAAACFLVFAATATVEAATTKKPTTLKPTTVKPTTMKPTTMKATTKKPTTVKPTTMKPTTMKATTMKPTTVKQTTMKPTTIKPTTLKPTTMKPTTVKPTTLKPTTMKPTTVKPTTMKPTTVQSTTVKPTTVKPTTMKPTTVNPPTTLKPTDATTLNPPTTLEPTDATTLNPPTTLEPTDATTLNPSTVTTLNPETTTIIPASETTLMPTSTTTLAPSPATDYCNIGTCSVPTDNTLCKYSNTTWGAACKPAYTSKSIVTDADIVTILGAHNDYRRKVAQGLETQGNPGPQPSASNMRELKWDQELAVMAQAHAQQCVYKHDTCRNVPRFRVGQNIYIGASSADNLGISDWNGAVTEWYNEVQYMNAAYATSFPASPPQVIGHYTQVVWADTYLVGCAVAYFQSTATFGAGFPYNRFYVCNYGPTGNWIGSPVYSQGVAGSACPIDTANNNGLCV